MLRIASVLSLLGLAALAPAAAPRPAAAPTVPGARACPIFPTGNVWNKRIDALPVHPDSARLVAAIGLGENLHPDFSDGGNYGIPYNVVDGAKAKKVRVRFDYADESDKGPYLLPASPRTEGGSDRHVLVVDKRACKLYELFAARRSGGGWEAGSGAIWNLRSNKLRRAGWTSADAAGLPILPGLARYDEVKAGAIRHALRFTAERTSNRYVYPARHQAGDDDASLPPMGLRVRLKASVNIARYPKQARIVLQALKTYGMILADNGSPWYVTGAPNRGWDDDALHTLGQISGSDFEVVDTGKLRNTS